MQIQELKIEGTREMISELKQHLFDVNQEHKTDFTCTVNEPGTTITIATKESKYFLLLGFTSYKILQKYFGAFKS